MNNEIINTAPTHVMCPLVDNDINAIDCIENSMIVNRELKEKGMPLEFKQKENWREICANCKWFGY